jgi:processive 1,2-diacylglycerol beta-glucosyltransferase
LDSAKKILILHASAGHGHERAAQALEQACHEAFPQDQVKLYDALALTEGFFGRGYKKTYLFLIQHLPWLWGIAYYLTDVPFIYFLIRPARRCVNRCVARRLENLILQDQPDLVIATHFLAVEVVSRLKRKKLCHARLVTVITDYLAHSFWLARAVDLYAVGSEETKVDLKKRGVMAEKILVTGIPVEKKFSETISREAAGTKLGLNAEYFTVLITSGGAGVGALEGLVKNFLNLKKPAQLLVVCGTNKSLATRLETIARINPLLRVFGFVDNIHELMAASNFVIGKGGGLTVTESLSLGKPMILLGSVPGQETGNARSMARQGAARVARSISEVLRFATEWMDSQELLMESTRAALRLGRPKAASEIIRRVLEPHG